MKNVDNFGSFSRRKEKKKKVTNFFRKRDHDRYEWFVADENRENRSFRSKIDDARRLEVYVNTPRGVRDPWCSDFELGTLSVTSIEVPWHESGLPSWSVRGFRVGERRRRRGCAKEGS